MNGIDGKWEVGVTSGPMWFRSLKGNVKTISDTSGYNRMRCFLWGIRWGPFDIEWDPKCGWWVFTYRNGKIVDKVQFVNSNKLKGLFYLSGKLIGEFTMTRMS